MTDDTHDQAPTPDPTAPLADTQADTPPDPAPKRKRAPAAKKRKTTARKGTKKRGESSTSPRRIKAITEKQLNALEYRKLGYSFKQIAEALGYKGAQGAYEAVQAALRSVIREPAEDVLSLELERLDALFVKPYSSALAGDLQALSACLAVMGRKARLLGLDAPVKTETTGANGGPIQQQVQVHHMTTADMEAAAARLAEKY
jgi:hypothetical protein